LPTILHTADVHLGRVWTDLGVVAQRLGELQWQCFEKVCRLAAERGAVALVIAGDLFERPDPPGKLVDRVRGLFKRLAGEGVAVIIAPGTHDPASSPRSVYRSEALGGARVFLRSRLGERFVAERAGARVAFAGLSWDPQATPRDFLADYDPADDAVPEVVVLHAEVGAKEGRRPKDLPVRPGRLAAAGAAYVALGHRHEHREFRSKGLLWGAYSGSPFGLSFRGADLGPRTACLVSLEEHGVAGIERLATTGVQWLRAELDLTEIASQEELLSQIGKLAGPERLVRLELRGAPAFALSTAEISARLADDFLFLEIEDSCLQVAVEGLEELAGEQSVRGIFARRMRKRLAATRSEASRAEVSMAVREGLRALSEEEPES
jgi:DNA repair exonuclease SbcCD nuclease subunit